MVLAPQPGLILKTLLPHLKVAAAYARQLQSKITALPAKLESDNFLGAALTDADISIQNLVEVVLLGTFPQIRFYGEEYQKSANTKYFRATDFGEFGDYLVTLDPIDGTQFYLDGHQNYQIILSVLNTDDYEAVITLSPAINHYCYALRGQGVFEGTFEVEFENCKPLQKIPSKAAILLGWGMEKLKPFLINKYPVIDIATSYSKQRQIPNVNGLLGGELSGAIIRSGNLIDSAALAFMAKEAGYLVTLFDGSPVPPLNTCKNYKLPGLLIACNSSIHQDLLTAVKQI
ncbi:inositol monophosphatase [Rippkaea orientalis PCC 8801]|uniref:Inositol monophosphatase n=1 Tax=Rippkaea orientalis (strain PCC 8801 / RF-1) TaxID=41431 RepID=B7JVU8_RIPO1|nr:inositol monophosphatase family protein [Rippkaea orientalis]ACK64669.1 inositol monophosphatase [Rippkaea orientalis PCC 8801]